MSEYALLAIPHAWSKSQNPVWFTDLDTLGVDENSLKFEPMPHENAAGKPTSNANLLADLKRQVGLLFNVPGSVVEIIIRL
jgi:hypothetical protein